MNKEKLQSELKKLPSNQRYFNNGVCYFGLPIKDDVYKDLIPEHDAIITIPKKTKGFTFYMGSDNYELLKVILQNFDPNKIESLFIGWHKSHNETLLNFIKISELLSNIYFLNLKEFYLGTNYITGNDCYTLGSLGNISKVIDNMPKLERLELDGYFKLNKKITLPKLKEIEILIHGDMICNIKQTSNKSIQNIFNSYFPELKVMIMCLYYDYDDYSHLLDDIRVEDTSEPFTFPDSFLQGKNTPNIDRLHIEGIFKKPYKKQIEASDFWKNKHLSTDGMIEID